MISKNADVRMEDLLKNGCNTYYTEDIMIRITIV